MMTTASMRTGYESILQLPGSKRGRDPVAEDTVVDLALARIIVPLAEGAPRARTAFLTPLETAEQVQYRHDVFRCLDSEPILRAVSDFHQELLRVHAERGRAAAAREPYRSARIHLGAVLRYIAAVEQVTSTLPIAIAGSDCSSDGLVGLSLHLRRHTESAEFIGLADRARRMEARVDALRYSLLIRGPQVTISADAGDADLTTAVRNTFSRFHGRAHPAAEPSPFMGTFDHVQGWVLEKVAELFPDVFGELVVFAADTREFEDPLLHRFEEEIPFYFAFRQYVAPFAAAGLPLAYPAVSAEKKQLRVTDGWDMALAASIVDDGTRVVTNDLELSGPERILVVTGPNQGGKTTTARLFGQIHHLAAIGCLVPAREAIVFLSDQVLTLFDREEDDTRAEGRLATEVERLHELFRRATPNSVVVFNELFSSTSLADARLLTRDVLERVSSLECPAICVTFIDELSRLNERTVSMVCLIDLADPVRRTFRVERRAADGRAYAVALARKYGLTEEQIKTRIRVAT